VLIKTFNAILDLFDIVINVEEISIKAWELLLNYIW